MRPVRNLIIVGLALCVGVVALAQPASRPPLSGVDVLVFTKTAGFRHGSIDAGAKMFEELAREHGFRVTRTEDASEFSDERLARLDAVVFLNTTGDVLDGGQQEAFERFVRSGGGYLGIHAASDTEHEWPFYGECVGAYFAGHPRVQRARVRVEDRDHPATEHLPASWSRVDEWYNFKEAPEGVRVLMRLDTGSYEGSTMAGDHPIAWCREVDAGRSLYTGGGHTEEAFGEPEFRRHIVGALLWITRRDGDDAEQPEPLDPVSP